MWLPANIGVWTLRIWARCLFAHSDKFIVGADQTKLIDPDSSNLEYKLHPDYIGTLTLMSGPDLFWSISTHTSSYLDLYQCSPQSPESVNLFSQSPPLNMEKLKSTKWHTSWAYHYSQPIKSSHFLVLAYKESIESTTCVHIHFKLHTNWKLYFIQNTLYKPFFIAVNGDALTRLKQSIQDV